MPMSMFSLGIVLLVSAGTGKYVLGGEVAGAGALGMAISVPQVARLTDKVGQRRVLRLLIIVLAMAVVTLIECVQLRAPSWALLLSGVLVGASMPGLGAMVRARWSTLLKGSPQLHAAFSIESVADELIFVVGPVLVTLLVTDIRPEAGIIAVAVLSILGTFLFTAQRSTEPPPALQTPIITGKKSVTCQPLAGDVPKHATLTLWGAVPALSVLIPVYLLLGAMFVNINVST